MMFDPCEVEEQVEERNKNLRNAMRPERQRILHWFPHLLCGMVLMSLGLGACVWMSISGDRNPFTVVLVSMVSVFFLALLMFFGSVVRSRGSLFQRQSSKLLAYYSFTICFILGTICECLVVASLVTGGFWWCLVIVLPPCCYLAWVKWHHCSRSLEEEELQALAIILEPVAERTIEFRGGVLGGQHRPCVCSWPGKYESAWDEMVKHSVEGTVSAAVVFLPPGSPDFGMHDEIPESEGIQTKCFQANCWCVPLYGEKKKWGCRWWTKWIANIDLAVEKGAKLQVYYFKGMKGRGKVQDFSTAGKEHLRREKISKKKTSKDFKVLEGCIRELSKQKRADGSSQYSREVERLFLAWLPEEERKFMQASEGLGNSQKAEVAWLDKKGYDYVEVDISQWKEDSKWNLEVDMPQSVRDEERLEVASVTSLSPD